MVSLDDVLALLNFMAENDPVATRGLIANRVPCQDAIVNHPSIQTGSNDRGATVGMLGVLNGFFNPVVQGDYQGKGQIFMIQAEDTGDPRFVKADDLQKLKSEGKLK